MSDEPRLNLNKKRKKRTLGPGGEFLKHKDELIPSPAYDPRDLEDIVGRAPKETLKHKARDRFIAMRAPASLPGGHPRSESQFRQAVEEDDQHALRFLLRHALRGSNRKFTLTGQKELLHVTYQLRSYIAEMLIAIDINSDVDSVMLPDDLMPGGVRWNALRILGDGGGIHTVIRDLHRAQGDPEFYRHPDDGADVSVSKYYAMNPKQQTNISDVWKPSYLQDDSSDTFSWSDTSITVDKKKVYVPHTSSSTSTSLSDMLSNDLFGGLSVSDTPMISDILNNISVSGNSYSKVEWTKDADTEDGG